MRIEVALASALAAFAFCHVANAQETAPRHDSTATTSRFTVGLGLETAIVGLSFGVRPELQYRLGPPGTISHFRTSVGLLFGPEFTFVPVSIGYRAVFRQGKTVQPLLGTGLQSNFFLVSGGPVFAQLGVFYLEGGSGFALNDRLSIGAAASLEWAFIGEPGPGLALRVFGGWKF